MLLRRITKHVTEQNWFAIFIDFIIVVVGILIAFQITNWSEAKGDRLRERQIIVDFLADLEIDRSQYQDGINLAVRKVNAVNASFKGAGIVPLDFEWKLINNNIHEYSMEAIKESKDSLADSPLLWSHTLSGVYPVPSTLTYDAIIGSGDIKLIQDRQLVRAIQRYQNRTASLVIQNEKIVSVRESTMMAGAAYGLAIFKKMPADEYLQLVSTNAELVALINIQGIFAIFHLGDIQDADKQAAELQDLLTTYLEAAP
jgi:hypothetical protein